LFRRIEAENYRCLKSVKQPLNPFEILIGANASGKSTFLDVMAFLGDFVREGLERAVEARTANFHDLVWGREGSAFSLAVEAAIPEDLRGDTAALPGQKAIRYQTYIQLDTATETLRVASENAELRNATEGLRVLARTGSRLEFWSESPIVQPYGRENQHQSYSGLTSIPSDSGFPVLTWLFGLLREGVQTVALDAQALQKPSPPGRSNSNRITGTDLARSIARLSDRYPDRFQDWIAHIRTALPDLRTIRTELREEDKHRYLMVEYENGVRVPSWILSEGTLRLLALTILAYLPDFRGVYLIEEPENGVHPAALETIYQSLSSVYDAQVLVASHSPILLNMASPEQILVFSKAPDGVKIVRGSDHPALADWQKEVSLGTLAASGILE
jgi:predicted ATPase